MFRLDGRVAVITGGGSGIGRAIALLFARQGASVHVIDLDLNGATETAEEISQNGVQAFAWSADVSHQSQINTVFKDIGPLDILINNAGIAHIGNAANTGEAEFDRVFNINVKGVYNCLHAALPLMTGSGGTIINLASIAAHVGLTDRFAYSMSKGAIHAMTLSVARDYISQKIRCNSISPARVHTPFVDGFIAKNYPGRETEMFEKLSKSQPVGRMALPDEVANLALFLCSDEAAFITGCDYPLDGGFINLNT